jgi:hypothetical protein
MSPQRLAHLAAHATAHTGGPSWTTAIQTAAAVLTGAALLAGAYRAAKAVLQRTILSRRHLAACLNQLACGTTSEYTDSILGPPAFRRALLPDYDYEDKYEEHIYRTHHAWVQTVIRTADKSVDAFAITVTDPRFPFRTRELTNTNLDIRLGRARFSAIPCSPDGYRVWWGANRSLHAESYYFGNPGNYQIYVAARNDAGTGQSTVTSDDPTAGTWESGRLRTGLSPPAAQAPVSRHGRKRPDTRPCMDPPPRWVQDTRARNAINTILITRAAGSRQPKALSLGFIGVDYGLVRVLLTPQRRKLLRAHRRLVRRLEREQRRVTGLKRRSTKPSPNPPLMASQELPASHNHTDAS